MVKKKLRAFFINVTMVLPLLGFGRDHKTALLLVINGSGFVMPLRAGHIKDVTGSYEPSFWISAAVLIGAVILCRPTKRPTTVRSRGKTSLGRTLAG
ncbi:MAG: hypothetical protein ACLQPD_29160 [Desulfomonilaceae bacterium]